ncbi:ABC transporter permease [Clostridium tetani]|uniref:ABC transporter ATP-binding protein n=1 Tax=Clostridium tetani (strain Massachusetts / E88) TaxID=212717 RepID=Q893B3_CLOTE|nr:FtsX-like permease family protein [Clostridium tetani]AAO36429.1 ABC transporter ATP-binding protein [Clostridium tetani E88]KGI37608.1 ABC transporter permease [Clostridium tetani]KGI39535.1 ABC transporter permease [Clostridium tetani ATCC 9441]KGI45671.1 ABC transporter permease [Clostridium tetani]KHO31557.1 ABC transporter permease [Clostridium tetani]
MNIFNKITLQGMKKSRTRTIVTVIGVILSAAMITAVATFGTSLLNFLVNGSIVKYGDWHVEFLDVDSSFVQERTHDNGVANTVVFENIGYATLDGGKSPEKPYLFLAGFSEEAFDTLPISLISGRLPENSEEILVPAHVAAKGGVRFTVGDTLSLAVGRRIDGNKNLGQHDPYLSGGESGDDKEVLVPKAERTYTVVGICERPGFEEHSAPGYTLITKADTADQAESFSIFVTLKNPRGVQAYASSTAGARAYIFNDYVLRFMGASDNKLFNALLYAVGGILVAIIMVGSIFLIYNSFNISLNERTRQFGILSSVGATAGQLRNSVLFEGLCIGAIGIPIGVMVGIGSIGFVIPIVARNFGNILYSTVPLTLSVSVHAIVAAVAVSLVTILISAYIPARKAANTPVMESIRQTNEVKTESKVVKTSKLVQRIYGLEGALALKNFKRNKKRYRSIVLSLVLSVVLFVSGSAFGTTLKRLSERLIMDFDYDIFLTTQDIDDSEMFPLYDKLKTADGVYESSYQAVFAYSCAVKASDFSDRYREYVGYSAPDQTVYLPMDIQFIEDSEYLRFIKELSLPAEEYTGQGAKMIAVAKKRVDKKDGPSELFDMFASRSTTFSVAPETNDKPMMEQGQSINITFVDTYPVDPPPRQSSKQRSYVFMVVAPYSLKEKFETPDTHADMGLAFLSKNPSQSVADMEAMIQDAGIMSAYTLYNVYAIVEQYRSLTFVIDVFTYVFVIMISLIAVANVFNTISTNIRLRRRELAMLRSVGMSDRDFNKMMNFECVFYGMRTLLFGLPIAAIISWLIYKGLVAVERMDNFDFVFPWGSMIISVFSVLFIVFITMLYAISKIKKENIIDALRDDMT